MSDTFKEGKRSKGCPSIRPRSPQLYNAIMGRHHFGSTEKILRRNRKIWTRLAGKISRRLDKEAVAEGMK